MAVSLPLASLYLGERYLPARRFLGIDIPAFLKLVGQKDFEGALRKIKEKNFLPAICGRVCPQEDQCEMVCGGCGQIFDVCDTDTVDRLKTPEKE